MDDELLRSIRSILEFERELTGRYLPVSTGRGKKSGRDDFDPPAGSSSPSSPASDSFRSRSDSTGSMSDPSLSLFDENQEPNTDPPSSKYEVIERLIAADNPIREMGSLEEVERYMEQNHLVPIDERRTNLVFGVGPPDADLMVVGEAPGADEDAQGEPFVGRAGKLLDKILAAIDFDRGDVYIANILKSRPPNNRNPRPEEVDAHLPVLYKQIALIEPVIVLCVGKVAANTLLDRSSSLGSMRQQVQDFHGLPVVVTYHPAALLRNPNWKRPTWEDVKLLRRRYDDLVDAASSTSTR